MSTFLFSVIGKPAIVISKINKSHSWIFIISFALFSAAIPYILYTKGLSKIEASKASIIANIEPVIAAVIGVWIFSEKINFLKILGIILVLGAVCIINMTDKLEN